MRSGFASCCPSWERWWPSQPWRSLLPWLPGYAEPGERHQGIEIGYADVPSLLAPTLEDDHRGDAPDAEPAADQWIRVGVELEDQRLTCVLPGELVQGR